MGLPQNWLPTKLFVFMAANLMTVHMIMITVIIVTWYCTRHLIWHYLTSANSSLPLFWLPREMIFWKWNYSLPSNNRKLLLYCAFPEDAFPSTLLLIALPTKLPYLSDNLSLKAFNALLSYLPSFLTRSYLITQSHHSPHNLISFAYSVVLPLSLNAILHTHTLG